MTTTTPETRTAWALLTARGSLDSLYADWQVGMRAARIYAGLDAKSSCWNAGVWEFRDDEGKLLASLCLHNVEVGLD